MKLVISKCIAQLKYVPTLAFYNSMFNVASTLENEQDFENWKATRDPDSALLFSRKRRTGLVVEGTSIALRTEDESTAKDLISEFTKYSTLFLDESNVTEFTHAGVRRIAVYETEFKYDEYIEKFFDAFLKNKTEYLESIVDSIDDTLVVIEGTKDGFNIRVRFAPLKRDQWSMFYPRDTFTPEDFELKKETSIFIDLDVFSNTEKDYSKSIDDLQAIRELHQSTFEYIERMIKERA